MRLSEVVVADNALDPLRCLSMLGMQERPQVTDETS